jgi:hypothetical protein
LDPQALSLADEDSSYLLIFMLSDPLLTETITALKVRAGMLEGEQPDLKDLRLEIEQMSGFEIVEDVAVREELLMEKRDKEAKRFSLAENLIIFEMFYGQY